MYTLIIMFFEQVIFSIEKLILNRGHTYAYVHVPHTGELHFKWSDDRLKEIVGVHETVLRASHQNVDVDLEEVGHLGNIQFPHCYCVVL